MRISDWSSDVCSSDLGHERRCPLPLHHQGTAAAVGSIMTIPPLQCARRIPRAAVRAGASLTAMSLALMLARPAQAQPFDATYNPAFPLGFAYIYTSPGGGTPATPPTTTVEVYARTEEKTS